MTRNQFLYNDPDEKVGDVPSSEECDEQVDQSWDPPTSDNEDEDD